MKSLHNWERSAGVRHSYYFFVVFCTICLLKTQASTFFLIQILFLFIVLFSAPLQTGTEFLNKLVENFPHQKSNDENSPEQWSNCEYDIRCGAQDWNQLRCFHHHSVLCNSHTGCEDHYHEQEPCRRSDQNSQRIAAPAEWVTNPEEQREDTYGTK